MSFNIPYSFNVELNILEDFLKICRSEGTKFGAYVDQGSGKPHMLYTFPAKMPPDLAISLLQRSVAQVQAS